MGVVGFYLPINCFPQNPLNVQSAGFLLLIFQFAENIQKNSEISIY